MKQTSVAVNNTDFAKGCPAFHKEVWKPTRQLSSPLLQHLARSMEVGGQLVMHLAKNIMTWGQPATARQLSNVLKGNHTGKGNQLIHVC